MKQKQMIVFAPHPDDETYGCGGIIAKKISHSYEVLVVVLTDGRHAFTKILGIYTDPTPEELKAMRRQETIRSVKILGVPEENVTFLDFEDGTLEQNEESVQKRVTEFLRGKNPTEVYIPYEKDYHPDHRATNRVVRRVLNELGISAVTYQYSIVHKYGRIGPVIDAIINVVKRNKIYIDVSNFLSLKEKAIHEIKSEVSIISPQQKKALLSDPRILLKEKEAFFVTE
jgi:LmbE family N-acetylglucosaminyl deacetylase